MLRMAGSVQRDVRMSKMSASRPDLVIGNTNNYTHLCRAE